MPPLFPSLIRFLGPFFGSALLAGLFISHFSILYAIKLSYGLFREWGAEDFLAKRATAFMLIFPTSFFFFSIYTESLFLAITLLALRSMKKHSWSWSGFWIFCALLTRLQGLVLIVPLIYMIWRQDQPFLRRISHWVGLGLPAFGGFFYLFLRALQIKENVIPLIEPILHTRIVPPWESFIYSIQTLKAGQSTIIDMLNLAATTLIIVLVIIGWRKIPMEYNLYVVFSLLVMVSRIEETQPLTGMIRFTLSLFPVFFTLGEAGRRPWLQRLIVYSSFSLNLFLSFQFFTWGWVA